jgi:putative transposase
MILKAYKFRIYPNVEQKILIAKHFGSCRWLWNHTLDRKIKAYTKNKKHLSRFELQKEIPSLKKKKSTSWLKEINSQSLQSILEHQDKAFTKFFRDKKGFPKFKSKRNEQSFQCPQSATVDFDAKELFLPKFKTGIKTVFHRKFEGKIKTVTIRQKASGKYFVSILVEVDIKEAKIKTPNIKKAIGIDLGIKDFIITSDGEKISNPKYLKKSLKKLKRLQRWQSRKVKGSKGRNKSRIILARQYEKVTNQRLDFLHKITHELVCENQATSFCVEDLNVKGMMANHKLAQAISDVSWSKFVELLQYKSKWHGKNVIKIGRFEASSKTCSVCGSVNKLLTLSQRHWTCRTCKTKHDRDVNAAKNILQFSFHTKNKQEKIGQELSESTLMENGVHRKVSRSKKSEAPTL